MDLKLKRYSRVQAFLLLVKLGKYRLCIPRYAFESSSVCFSGTTVTSTGIYLLTRAFLPKLMLCFTAFTAIGYVAHLYESNSSTTMY